ncbi:MAG: prolipoprotein diacylglyceryl transferase [Deltaproteobacteria bacterium]|nr:prolipoprotein diacylglyceryl transferase [Deltaproteobacteria bacterium]
MLPRLHLGPFLGFVPTYLLTLSVAFVVAVAMTWYLARWTTGTGWWKPLVVALAAAIPALPGARLLTRLVEPGGCPIEGASDLWTAQGGLAFLGGVTLGTLGAWLACLLLRVPLLRFADAATPSVLLADAIGRFGCLSAGCCYGRPTTGPFAVVFDGFDTPPRPVGVPLHPTQTYESVFASGVAVVVLVLLARRSIRDRPGLATAIGLAGYGIGRFAVEFLRADPRGGAAGLSTSQWLSIGVLALAAALFLHARRRTASLPPAIQGASPLDPAAAGRDPPQSSA